NTAIAQDPVEQKYGNSEQRSNIENPDESNLSAELPKYAPDCLCEFEVFELGSSIKIVDHFVAVCRFGLGSLQIEIARHGIRFAVDLLRHSQRIAGHSPEVVRSRCRPQPKHNQDRNHDPSYEQPCGYWFRQPLS